MVSSNSSWESTKKEMTNFDSITHEQLKQDIVGVYDRSASVYDQVGIKQFTYYANLLIDRLNIPSLFLRFRDMLKPGGYIATTHPYVPIHDLENFERWKWLFELTREVFPSDFEPPASWVAPNRLNNPELIEAALLESGLKIFLLQKQKL